MLKLKNKVTGWFKRRARISTTVRELSSLNTRELADIGLTRSDIDRVAREANSIRSWSIL